MTDEADSPRANWMPAATMTTGICSAAMTMNVTTKITKTGQTRIGRGAGVGCVRRRWRQVAGRAGRLLLVELFHETFCGGVPAG